MIVWWISLLWNCFYKVFHNKFSNSVTNSLCLVYQFLSSKQILIKIVSSMGKLIGMKSVIRKFFTGTLCIMQTKFFKHLLKLADATLCRISPSTHDKKFRKFRHLTPSSPWPFHMSRQFCIKRVSSAIFGNFETHANSSLSDRINLMNFKRQTF